MSTAEPPRRVWSPLAAPAFLRLYLVYLLSFTAAGLVEVSAAWHLAEAGAEASLVALVSSAATLPVVLLIVPFGALADGSSRLSLIRASQSFAVLVSLVLAALALLGGLSAELVLALVLFAGVTMAMRLPSLTSLAPGMVGPADLPNAMTLFGMGSSATRLASPALAALAFALAGAAVSFLLSAILAALALVLARGLPEPRQADALPGERVFGAIRVAISYTGRSPELRRLLLRGFGFFLLGASAFALAPLAITQRLDGGSVLFMSVLCATGFGAFCGGFALPPLRARLRRRGVIRVAAALLGLGAALVALSPGAPGALAGAVLHGVGWLWGLSSFTSFAQQILPDWVRSRGMAVTHAAMISGVTFGAILWGQLADAIGPDAAILAAGILSGAAALVPGWLTLNLPPVEELKAHRYWAEPALAMPVSDRQGPAILTIDYQVDPDQLDAFLAAARESRRSRLRNGAISWSLYRDLEDPLHFTEHVVFADWADRRRQEGRTTEADFMLRHSKIGALEAGKPARISHWLAVPL